MPSPLPSPSPDDLPAALAEISNASPGRTSVIKVGYQDRQPKDLMHMGREPASSSRTIRCPFDRLVWLECHALVDNDYQAEIPR